MKRLLLVPALLLALGLAGCGQTPCAPSPGYVIPAHWIPDHRDYETGYYTDKDGAWHYGRHWVYVPPQYIPVVVIAPITCPKGGQA